MPGLGLVVEGSVQVPMACLRSRSTLSSASNRKSLSPWRGEVAPGQQPGPRRVQGQQLWALGSERQRTEQP